MLQISTSLRNAMLDSLEVATGQNPILVVRTGPPPASPAAANTGTVLATVNLPANWLADAAGGTKAKQGAWEDPAADASGTAGHFRIFAADGVTCHWQGTVTAEGGGGDMTLDNTNLAINQRFEVTGFTLTAPNA